MKSELMNVNPVADGEDNYTIEVIDHKEFPGDFQTASMTTVKLADIISSFFKPIFSDYAGCRVGVYFGNTGNNMLENPDVINKCLPVNAAASKMGLPIGAVYVDLFFRDNPPSNQGIKSINLIGGSKPKEKNDNNKKDKNNPAKDLGVRFMAQNKLSSLAHNGISYEVNKKTYQMLEEFRFNYNGIRPVRWSDLKSEIIRGMHPTSSKNEALVCISCLDVNAIVSAIFGTEGEDGKKYAYTVRPASPIIGLSNEFLVHIVQMDIDVVERTSAELGMYNVNNIGFHSC